MRPPRPGLTLPRLKIIVVVVGLISLNGFLVARQYINKGLGPDALILASFGCTFGLVSMRHPRITLGILIAVNIFEPNLYGYCNPDSLPASGCTVGWLMGAPTGWISRHFKQSLSVKDQPGPSKLDLIETVEL